MAADAVTSSKVSKNSNIAELISLSSIDELDFEWVNEELSFLEGIAEEKASFSKSTFKKDDAVKKLELFCNHASSASKLLRVLFRLAKENFNSKQFCQEFLTTLATNNTTSESAPVSTSSKGSYASTLKKSPVPTVMITNEKVPEKSPEITLIPKNNYEADFKKVSEKLKTQQVVSARKSKAGNIVLRCDKKEDIGGIEQALKSENFVTIKKMEKNLPRMTIFDVGRYESPEDLKQGLFSKNPFLEQLVAEGNVFEVLFFKKFNDAVNVVIKCDPVIRETIIKNRSRLFLEMKSCRVSDSFPFIVCFNCQKTCCHKSDACTLINKTICRYCGENHLSKNCSVKDDSTKHFCVNCSQSENVTIKNNCRTHVSNSTQCPLIKSIVNNIKANTCYTTASKNG